MYVITFYSFKGGVGRTMALVNVAAELVRRGRKVLVVDFDLEAPGLETYKRLRPKKPHPGIVEYVTEFRRTQQVPDLRDYIYETKPIGKKGGRLWVMPAGRRDRAYRSALAGLDWQRLYRDEDGFLLFEDTKKGWEEELKPDYVLIDSRTGDTDVLGICTRQLPDSVVLMFTPNEQNLAGLENVCRDIRREATEGLKKTIRLHFVAANVPDLDDEKRILHRHLQAFRKRLEFKDLSGVIRRYENLNLLEQSVFTLDRPHTRLARAHRRLLRTLLKDNFADREGALLFLRDYPERHEARLGGEEGVFTSEDGLPLPSLTSEPPASLPPSPPIRSTVTWRSLPTDAPENKMRGHLMVHLSDHRQGCCIAFWRDIYSLHRIGRYFKDDAEILNKVAKSFILEEEYRIAVQLLNRVLELEPKNPDPLFQRAVCKTKLIEIDDAASDFLACLRILGPGHQTLTHEWRLQQECLARLCVMAPAKLAKLAEMVEKQEIQGLDLPIVAGYLCRTAEGVPVAARLLRSHLAGSVEWEKTWGLVRALLQARCWQEVIQLHEAGRSDPKAGHSVLYLALAYWGENGEMPEALCREALESGEETLRTWGLQVLAILLWRTGDLTNAFRFLDRAEQEAHAETDEIFSWWWLRDVSVGQYLDDCRLVRRMFQGEPLRPAFLGPAPTTAPA